MYKNKYDKIIINKYSNYQEELRFDKRSNNVEFVTTMEYIKKYAKKGAKILEVGAGTGAYSIALAKMGYNVTAVELVERNVTVMKELAGNLQNIKCLTGDALNLNFDDNEFDIIINLGPMYHLNNTKDRKRAISESIRVCKPNGILMFAYITHSGKIWSYGVKENDFKTFFDRVDKNGRIKDSEKSVFSSFHIEDFKKLFEKTNTKYLKNIATDGLFPTLDDVINNQLSDENFNSLLKYHLNTCERLDMQGLSAHLLYICKKGNK